MVKNFRHSNGTIVRRAANGRFRRSNLGDIGIKDDQLQNGNAICVNCNYGEDGKWFPILKTGTCPSCGSKDKKESTCIVEGKKEPPYMKNGFVDPVLFRKWKNGDLK